MTQRKICQEKNNMETGLKAILTMYGRRDFVLLNLSIFTMREKIILEQVFHCTPACYNSTVGTEQKQIHQRRKRKLVLH